MKLFSVVGGTYTEVDTISLGQNITPPTYIQASITGSTVVYGAYSDNGTTVIGSTSTYTATSPTKTNSHGIVKAYSANQGSTLDNFAGGL